MSVPVAPPMVRFGGRPYFDGVSWRCPDCNAITVQAARAVCAVCGHRAIAGGQREAA